MTLRSVLGSVRHQGIAATYSQRRWHRDPANEARLLNVCLGDRDVVIDGGGYQGDFCDALISQFPEISVLVFEPDQDMCHVIGKRMAPATNVEVRQAALWSSDQTLAFSRRGIASTVSPDLQGLSTTVIGADVAGVIDEAQRVALLKLNIEGAEYEVLGRLCGGPWIGQIDQLLVQFHRVPGSGRSYRTVVQSLERTHRRVWRWPWVWEYWVRFPYDMAEM